MGQNQTSGLLLPLKLISHSLETIDSKKSQIIRKGIIKMLEDKLEDVEVIPEHELPQLKKLLEKISAAEPKVVAEVRQIIEKFHPVNM